MELWPGPQKITLKAGLLNRDLTVQDFLTLAFNFGGPSEHLSLKVPPFNKLKLN
jgi:hypothetical protein